MNIEEQPANVPSGRTAASMSVRVRPGAGAAGVRKGGGKSRKTRPIQKR